MRFQVDQLIRVPRDQVMSALGSGEYLEFLQTGHEAFISVKPLKIERTGDVIARQVEYYVKPVIPKLGNTPVPPEVFAFVEHSTLNTATGELRFQNKALHPKVASMLVNEGTIRLSSEGQFTRRTMQGEISLKVPFLLKPLAFIAEPLIHRKGLELLEAEVGCIERYAQTTGRKQS